MRYDRTALQRAAEAAGQPNSWQMADRLGIGKMTAWRLWHGHGAPSVQTAVRVELVYSVPMAALLKPTEARTEVPV
ncbi:XRE family transcriptional regulator [Streptomyces sp. NPDC002519]